MKKTIFFLIIPTALLLSQNYKQNIMGSIYDSKTNKPVVGANVVIVDSKEGVSTNGDGNFILSLNPGKYILRVSCIGFKNLIDTISITNNNKMNVLRYGLEEYTMEISEVAFCLSKEAAIRDISQKQYCIYIHWPSDSMQSIAKKVALKYGFTICWPEGVFYLYNVGDYNETMIKYLENRNGENWYENYLEDLKIFSNSK
jgi:hypothetical protein